MLIKSRLKFQTSSHFILHTWFSCNVNNSYGIWFSFEKIIFNSTFMNWMRYNNMIVKLSVYYLFPREALHNLLRLFYSIFFGTSLYNILMSYLQKLNKIKVNYSFRHFNFFKIIKRMCTRFSTTWKKPDACTSRTKKYISYVRLLC